MSLLFGRPKKDEKKSESDRTRLKLDRLEAREVPAQFLVTNLLDDMSGGTLREAVQDANAAGGDDEIIFQAGLTGTITLQQGELDVYNDALTVTGPGSTVITIDGNASSRIFDAETDLTVSGLTLANGSTSGGGGAIRAEAQLTVVNSVITGSSASGPGGGIYSGGGGEGSDNGVVIENSVISDNEARYYGGGIAIYNAELDSVINNTTITGNRVDQGESGGDGGGIAFDSFYDSDYDFQPTGGLTISNSTISYNYAEDDGGGAHFDTDGNTDIAITIINSTISTNTTEDDGGGIYTRFNVDLSILNSTIAYNIAQNGEGGGIDTGGCVSVPITLISTIVANNVEQNEGEVDPPLPPALVSPPPPPGTLNDLSGNFDVEYSLIRAPGSAVINETVPGSNIYDQDPVLGPLQNNGGPTDTHELDSNSPAVNTGSNPQNLAFDQRGNPFNRSIPTGDQFNTDIGAYEIQPPPPPPPPPNPSGVVPFVVGTGPIGGPHVRVLDPITGVSILDFLAYGESFQGGVNVAVGDVTGDGIADIITAPATLGGSDIRIFNSATGQLIYNFLAYPGFYGGVYVAAGDVDGDGIDDIITGAGKDGGPHVRVFKGGTYEPIRDFLAYAGAYFGGVSVAAADVNGDTIDDIITGSATVSSHVQVFNGTNIALLNSFIAYAPAYDHGITVAAADFNGDNLADIVTGSGTFSSNVRIFNPTNLSVLANVIVYPDFDGGVRVGIAFVNGSYQVATGTGSGGGPHVRIFSDGLSLTPNLELVVYGIEFQGGVNVSG